MMAERTEGTWIPLMDFAIKKGVSLSTLRRHIKANKIQYRVENGRYLLRDDDAPMVVAHTVPVPTPPPVPGSASAGSLDRASDRSQVARLEAELQKAREEIAELKMLVALYEDLK